jgi:ABC-type multidrug transport system fused ATPase/permease subunit
MVMLKPFLDILFAERLPELPEYKNANLLDNSVVWFNRFLIEYIQANGYSAGLYWVSAWVVSCFFFKNLFRYLSLYVMASVRNGIEYDIRKKLYDKILSLPLSYFSNEKKGDLMSRFSNDVNEIQWSILRSIETVVRSPITLLGSIFVMFYISPQLTIFSFGLFIFVGVGIGRLSKSLRKNAGKAQQSVGVLLSILEESISGLRIIQGFAAEKFLQSKFDDENKSYYFLNNAIQRRKELASPLSEFLGICVIATLLLYGGHLVFEKKFEASTFVMFILMFYNIIDPAKSFASAVYDFQKGRAASERIDQILKSKNELKDPDFPAATPLFERELVVEKLTFSYDGQQNVLEDISFKLTKGKTIAIIGVSGSGKSTLADLLPRFYDLQKGKITIDGTDIFHIKLRELRSLFGIVSQDAILFNDSIYNNIIFGRENFNMADVENAARIANAHEFILQTEKGYQTSIGDRGMKLSGGQRQRITLARALLGNPPILLMDEATSALDAESEKAVHDALQNVLKNTTAVVIAHRMSTIQNADEILVLQEGKITERGNHISLMANSKVYKNLIDLQSSK